MRVAYLHLPRFPVQRRTTGAGPAASRPGSPLVLVQAVRGVQRVAFASVQASAGGIRTGMTLPAARALVPTLCDLPFDPVEEDRALASVAESLLALSPAYMPSLPDGLWLDASAAPLFGGEEELARRALALLHRLGLSARSAVASELFTARALARFGETRVAVIPGGESARALAPLPLQALEGVEERVHASLAAFGVLTLGEVARLVPSQVRARLGGQGLRAITLARGEDEACLLPARVPELVEEVRLLDSPAETLEPLLFVLKGMVDALCARQRARSRAALRLMLTLVLEPAGPFKVPLVLARPSNEPRLLLDLLRHQLEDLRLPAPVASVVLTVDASCEDHGQQRVLGALPEGDAGLESVLARLATAFGPEALSSPRALEDHRPEAARARAPFRPPAAEPGLLAQARRQSPAPQPADALSAERPVRLLAEPSPLPVDLGPAGELQGARLLGRRHAVLGLDGPERISGQWWAAAPFARDYYRVHFEGLGPAWIFRDGGDGRFYLHGFFD